MTEHTASRTLVKSPPELWAECSDAAALTRHLDRFGEITITRLEPETAVAWEGEQVRGTVRLEPSGWGTKVTLTAVAPQAAVAEVAEPVALVADPVAVVAEPVAEVKEPEPELAPAVTPAKQPGMFSRLLAKLVGSAELEPELVLQELTAEVVPAPEPEVVAEPEVVPEPVEVAAEEPPAPASLATELADAEAALVAALDSLGQAHRRPFSRG
ncbi:MAG TPA: hypothetical protein VMD48_08290 [Solirubrobacteraceae bacterium]|nr:hypothetical protein [Solirubrobacteraceae bacterium]